MRYRGCSFGSEEMIYFISEWGSTATFSINLTQIHCLWSMLRSDLPPNHWKYAVIKGNKIHACFLISSSNSIIYQQIMTTMIAGNEDESESNSEQSEESEEDRKSVV